MRPVESPAETFARSSFSGHLV